MAAHGEILAHAIWQIGQQRNVTRYHHHAGRVRAPALPNGLAACQSQSAGAPSRARKAISSKSPRRSLSPRLKPVLSCATSRHAKRMGDVAHADRPMARAIASPSRGAKLRSICHACGSRRRNPNAKARWPSEVFWRRHQIKVNALLWNGGIVSAKAVAKSRSNRKHLLIIA